MRAFAFASCIAVLSGFAFGQSAETKPTFEIADVHVSPAVRYPYMRGPMMRSGRYEIHVATMLDLVSKAYGVDSTTVIGGPAWLEEDRFDVIAKGPEGTTLETAKPLLQALLAERFKLVVHNGTQKMPAYGLRAGKHVQMKDADGTGDTGCKFAFPPPPPPPAPGGPPPPPPVVTYACHNMTMAAFAEGMRGNFLASQYLNDKLVLDQTELKGTWNFDFKYAFRGMGGGPGGNTAAFIDAFDKQLGLTLVPIETPMPVIIVDSVDQKPSANLPDIAEKLHIEPTPKEFEVATLKPTPPDFRGMRLNVEPSGRVNIAGINLKFLMEQAWQLNDDAVFGAQKWMETDRYDIVAKAPVSGNQLDIEDLFAMLRAFLTERFQLKTHMEDRPVTAYTLKEIKPKMAKADPASRTRCKEGPAGDGKDPRDKIPARARLLTCQNLTMDQLAARLRLLAPGYIHSAVLNATELKGGYDFSLNFSPAGMPGTGGGPGPGAAAPPPGDGGASSTASDPNGAITLFEAIEKQLGLKLEASKRPVPVLVIDHAEQKPTEN